jgi:hypothetical protein
MDMNQPRRGYPLGALFVVVTACAVLAAGVTPLIRLFSEGEEEIGRFLGAIVIGAVCGFVIGVITGLVQFRTALGGGMGAMAGTLIGAAAGLVALLRASQLAPAAAAMTAGSALIIGVALMMRRKDL